VPKQLPNSHSLPLFWQITHDGPYRCINFQLSIAGQRHHGDRGKHLGDRGDQKTGVCADRDSSPEICETITLCVENGAIADYCKGSSGYVTLSELTFEDRVNKLSSLWGNCRYTDCAGICRSHWASTTVQQQQRDTKAGVGTAHRWNVPLTAEVCNWSKADISEWRLRVAALLPKRPCSVRRPSAVARIGKHG
jgi:hypothetical protein